MAEFAIKISEIDCRRGKSGVKRQCDVEFGLRRFILLLADEEQREVEMRFRTIRIQFLGSNILGDCAAERFAGTCGQAITGSQAIWRSASDDLRRLDAYGPHGVV